jgi:hypothetical protein
MQKQKYLKGLQPNIKSIKEVLELHHVDCSFFGPEIHNMMKTISRVNGVKEETVLFVMLPIIATACGMKTYIESGTHEFSTKPNVFAVNVLNSGGSKSVIANGLMRNTIKKLHNEYRDLTLRRIEDVRIEKDTEITGAQARDAERARIRLSAHTPLASKGTAESMFHYAGNGAMLMYYDELATFIEMFMGKERKVQILTELYQTHSVEKTLIGRESTSVIDSSLSLYAHGTPTYGRHLLSSSMRADGSCWRFWINIDTPEPITLSMDEFMEQQSMEIPDFTTFDRLFHAIKDSHFKSLVEINYSYTKEALTSKHEIWKKLLWVTKSMDETNETLKSMLLKLLAIIDKCALIHTIVKENISPSPFNYRSVDQDSFDFGWSMARMIWTGWMQMIQMEENKNNDTELKTHKIKKPTINNEIYARLLDQMGGPGIYDLDVWERNCEEFNYKDRTVKHRFKKWMTEDPNRVIVQGQTVILTNGD